MTCERGSFAGGIVVGIAMSTSAPTARRRRGLASSGIAVLFVLATLLAGCSTPPRTLSHEAPLGAFLTTGAKPTDPDRVDPRIVRSGLIGAMERLAGRRLKILELSGGGQYGAFGAGFLNGWTARGDRPRFDLVTGISTGALLATHAFLGTPADDLVLKRLYTEIDRRDIYRERVLGAAFGGPALNDTDPMARLIDEVITPRVLERVAAEFDNNRRLFVAATNLDYKQVWVFSLGLIAKQGGPQALELYRKVLHAAASVPIVFPPVEIDGHLFGDAAVLENLLVMGLLGSSRDVHPRGGGRGEVYVIVDGTITMPPKAVPDAIGPIAEDTVDLILGARMATTLVLSYAGARVHGYGFNMAAIPPDVPISGDALAFDRGEMRRVFEAGYRLAKGPEPWQHRPPASDQLGPWAIRLFDHIDRAAP